MKHEELKTFTAIGENDGKIQILNNISALSYGEIFVDSGNFCIQDNLRKTRAIVSRFASNKLRRTKIVALNV